MAMRPSTLNSKLLRDIRERWAQLSTIGFVVAAGIAAFVSLQATFQSLEQSRDAYYDAYRFGDVFATLQRAPDGVAEKLEEIPGVTLVHPRLVAPVRIPLQIDGAAASRQPPIGQVVGLPPDGEPALNGVLLLEGRRVEAGRADEALLLEPFAERTGIAPGDTIPVVMEGRLREIRITGIAAAPEFVYPAPPGQAVVPDDERFAVLWMDRQAVAPAFQMEGAFNDVVLRLSPSAVERQVLAEVDRVLEPYGGRGAMGRDRQRSNYFLEMRLDQLQALSGFVPILFLGVAAFLLNLVLSRLVKLQRGEIAALKALGYRDREIGGYYLKLTLLVVVLGTFVGLGAGAWMGRGLTGFFTSFFRLPLLEYSVPLSVVGPAFLVAAVFGLLGAFATLRGILRLSPAEAMRPEPPERYRPTILERLGVGHLFGPPGRMILRELGRRPVRLLLSSLGIALALGIIVVGRFSADAWDVILDRHYQQAYLEDVSVTLTGPVDARGIREVAALPGVVRAEGVRVTSARIHAGLRWRDVPIYGYREGDQLRRLMDAEGAVLPTPSGGMVLTETLAEILAVGIGDSVQVQFREGRAQTRGVVVTGTVDEMFGLQGHMRILELNHHLGEGPAVNTLILTVDEGSMAPLQARLAQMPVVQEVTEKMAEVRRVDELTAEPQRFLVLILSFFGSVIAVGVVYNNARVALSVRSRDLASLRVLGFTRREISGILLGEQAVQVALAIPAGLVLGRVFTGLLMRTLDPEEYRLPLMVSLETYAFATTVVVAAALVSALLVRRRLDHLDLIGVLKTRE